MGAAEAAAIEKKLVAEATGLAQKAESMKMLDGVGREHEEFRIQLEKTKDVELAAIAAKQEIAKAQAFILKEAFSQAKINIVGGDGAFFEKFIDAVSVGKSIDGTIDSSEHLQTALAPYLSGQKSLPADLKDVLSRPALTPEQLQQLSISGILTKLMMGADDSTKGKLDMLVAKAKELGIDNLGA